MRAVQVTGTTPAKQAPPVSVCKMKYAAMLIFGMLGITILLSAPPIAARFSSELGYNESYVGTYFFVELGAFSLATLPSYLWLGRANGRAVATTALIVFALGNLVSAVVLHHYTMLLSIRMITGLAGGTLMVLALATAGTAGNRDRAYALLIAAELAGAAIALFALPRLFELFGLAVFYVLLGIASLAAVGLVSGIDRNLGTTPIGRDGASKRPTAAMVALAITSVLLFYVAVGGIWTFASKAATAAGLDAVTSGSVLAVASLCGIVGAFAAVPLSGRVARGRMLLIGFALCVTAIFGLALWPSIIGFTASIFAFKFAWTFVLPSIFGAATKSDPSGRMISTLNAVAGAGLALGPLIAGIALDNGISLATLLLGAGTGGILSFATIISVERIGDRGQPG